jgi:hypothetical protein
LFLSFAATAASAASSAETFGGEIRPALPLHPQADSAAQSIVIRRINIGSLSGLANKSVHPPAKLNSFDFRQIAPHCPKQGGEAGRHAPPKRSFHVAASDMV